MFSCDEVIFLSAASAARAHAARATIFSLSIERCLDCFGDLFGLEDGRLSDLGCNGEGGLDCNEADFKAGPRPSAALFGVFVARPRAFAFMASVNAFRERLMTSVASFNRSIGFNANEVVS